MCGIVGKIYLISGEAGASDILAMNKKLEHRGPDDGGVYISSDRKVGMGHRRLSIIDLSPFGHQPMNYLDRYWIVFNGEIYNFQERRNWLKKEGYTFKSKTDTEVIMALYDRFGKQCLEHLRGMFAFAIYDEKEKILFCARDRVGKKPFKFYFDGNVFIFASELKAILTQSEYEKEPDYTAIHHFLSFQYCPAPFTGFKGINKLEPAHYILIDLKSKKMEKERYWRLDYSQKLELTENEWKRKILEKLEESVKLRMISDVPLGAFLSGGIDSSAIVGLMSNFSAKPVKTFSVGFQEKEYNELPFARIIAKKFQTDHNEIIIEPASIELIPEIIKAYEEPFADCSAFATYQLSKFTKNHVSVALTGDGGDENFGGYRRYSFFKLAQKLYPYKNFLSFANMLSRASSRIVNSDFLFKANYFSRLAEMNHQDQYFHIMYRFSSQIESMLSDEFKIKSSQPEAKDILKNSFQESRADDCMDQIFYTDFNTYLPDDLMVKTDIASMAVSLEARSPFLDQELLELTASMPADFKICGLTGRKYILKEALRDLLPQEIIQRSKKGFDIPIKSWFKDELDNYVQKILLSKKFLSRGIFQAEKVEDLLSKNINTRIDLSSPIWTVLMLEIWFQEYFD
jgi:asparagine synthase (glutamine-hydrolysing)